VLDLKKSRTKVSLYSFYGVHSWALARIVVVAKNIFWLRRGKITQDFPCHHLAAGGWWHPDVPDTRRE
jgi:hypothetical protein